MVQIRELTVDDLERVATIHLLAFPDSAITKLGHEAARRYYDWQLTGPHDAHVIGAYLEGELVGFCFGGLFRGALSGFLRVHRPFLVKRILTHPLLLANPLFRTRLTQGLTALRRFGPQKASASTPQKTPAASSFGILSIAVDPNRQGSGVGRALMDAAEAEARRRGFGGMHLTVHPQNDQAIRFYKSLGWACDAEGAEWNGRMRKALDL
jgi:ribosomal protein S18 acetylase RimI-like enzyme